MLIDTWAYGAHLVPEAHRGGRVGWADVWYRSSEGSSPYANPVTGLHFVVDLNRMELLEVEDEKRVEEPATMGEYVPHLVPGQQLRADLKPLEVVQPEGVSFTLDGNALRWQKWSLRVGFNHREGMVLHTVGYDGRSVAHRLSFAEMVVPTATPPPTTTAAPRSTSASGKNAKYGIFKKDSSGLKMYIQRGDPLPFEAAKQQ